MRINVADFFISSHVFSAIHRTLSNSKQSTAFKASTNSKLRLCSSVISARECKRAGKIAQQNFLFLGKVLRATHNHQGLSQKNPLREFLIKTFAVDGSSFARTHPSPPRRFHTDPQRRIFQRRCRRRSGMPDNSGRALTRQTSNQRSTRTWNSTIQQTPAASTATVVTRHGLNQSVKSSQMLASLSIFQAPRSLLQPHEARP
jgi:hypothetical protein